MTQPSIEEQVARYMAAKDWLEDATDDEWWNSRLPKFREDYLTSARKVIGIVNGTAPPVQCPAPEEQQP